MTDPINNTPDLINAILEKSQQKPQSGSSQKLISAFNNRQVRINECAEEIYGIIKKKYPDSKNEWLAISQRLKIKIQNDIDKSNQVTEFQTGYLIKNSRISLFIKLPPVQEQSHRMHHRQPEATTLPHVPVQPRPPQSTTIQNEQSSNNPESPAAETNDKDHAIESSDLPSSKVENTKTVTEFNEFLLQINGVEFPARSEYGEVILLNGINGTEGLEVEPADYLKIALTKYCQSTLLPLCWDSSSQSKQKLKQLITQACNLLHIPPEIIMEDFNNLFRQTDPYGFHEKFRIIFTSYNPLNAFILTTATHQVLSGNVPDVSDHSKNGDCSGAFKDDSSPDASKSKETSYDKSKSNEKSSDNSKSEEQAFESPDGSTTLRAVIADNDYNKKSKKTDDFSEDSDDSIEL